MADLTPEHASRRMDGDLHPEVRAAYKYVESVIPTADAQSPVGGYAWHGWSLREAFLAGCTHARTQLAQSEPKKSKPVVDYSRVPEIATEAQIRSAAQYLVKKRNCDGDLIPAIKYAIARWGRSTPQPEGEELTDEKLLRMAATEIGYEFTGSWFLTGRNSPNLEVTPLELLNLMRAVLARWGRPAPQPPAEGEVAELVEVLTLISDGMSALDHEWDSWFVARAAELLQRQHPQPVPVAIPGEEYHEDMGPVTWWRLPVEEPPWVGTPNDSDWPGYHTHFTPAPPTPCNAHALPLPAAKETSR